MFQVIRYGWATVLLAACLAGPLAAQTKTGSALQDTISRLSLTTPETVLADNRIAAALDELTRETCDRDAIFKLGRLLQDAGYRRDAANAHLRFSETCGGVIGSLRIAANILLNLSDYGQVQQVATSIIKLEPHQDNGYYLRAVAFDRSGNPKRAIDDYTTSLELFGDKQKISNVSYWAIARNYEKLGQYCDAILPIEAWVALNPARNETSQTRAMIADFTAKGKCPVSTAGEDVFPITRRGNVVIMPATINGVRGSFMFDTGATFVSLKKSFATAAKIDIDEDSIVTLNTANGVTTGKRGRARNVQLKNLKAENVVVVVQNDDKLMAGDKLDGLLGMSLLSRFNITIGADSIRIKSRTGR